MRKFLLLFILALIATEPSMAQKADSDSVSVAMATLFGEIVRNNLDNTRAAGVEINDSLFSARFVLALQGKPTGMSINRAQQIMQSVFDSRLPTTPSAQPRRRPIWRLRAPPRAR